MPWEPSGPREPAGPPAPFLEYELIRPARAGWGQAPERGNRTSMPSIIDLPPSGKVKGLAGATLRPVGSDPGVPGYERPDSAGPSAPISSVPRPAPVWS